MRERWERERERGL